MRRKNVGSCYSAAKGIGWRNRSVRNLQHPRHQGFDDCPTPEARLSRFQGLCLAALRLPDVGVGACSWAASVPLLRGSAEFKKNEASVASCGYLTFVAGTCGLTDSIGTFCGYDGNGNHFRKKLQPPSLWTEFAAIV